MKKSRLPKSKNRFQESIKDKKRTGYKPISVEENYNDLYKSENNRVIHLEKQQTKYFIISFISLLFIGLGNKIFQKLQTIPMRNYPVFVNLITTFIYVPLSFAYIIPMIKYGGAITAEQRRIPKSKFAIMGILDSIAGVMQVFAATYLGGSLLILLGQAAIPVSMLISKVLLHTRYSIYQYIGAFIVAFGLVTVLLPDMDSKSLFKESKNDSSTIFWSFVVILSCIPMCLSTVYKEIALGEAELDAVYLNGWVAVFQFMVSLPLAIPAAMIGNPSVTPNHLLQNLHDGMLCFVGQNTIFNGPHPDDCEMAPIYLTIYMLFNVVYNILIILILKYGSANILFLAMTIMVPMGNVAFTFPFVPGHEPLKVYDVIGLIVIMAGLFSYRFLEDIVISCRSEKASKSDSCRNHLDKSLMKYVTADEAKEVSI